MSFDTADPFISPQAQTHRPRLPELTLRQPPQYQAAMSRQDHAGMEALRVRNIELETELRLTKDELARAQGSTQYLVTCLAGQHADRIDHAIARKEAGMQEQIHQLQGELARLRAHHEQGPRAEDPKGKLSWCEQTRSGEGGVQHHGDGDVEATDQADFLTLNDDQADSLGTVQASRGRHAQGPVVATQKKVDSPLEDEEVSLIDLNPEASGPRSSDGENAAAHGDDEEWTIVTPTHKSEFVHHEPTPPQSPGARRAKLAELARRIRPIRTASTPPRIRAQRANNPFWKFAHFEEMHLMGVATFIEDKDEVEYAEFWEELEQGRWKGRHSKDEWRNFYEQVVRPKFLALQAASEVLTTEGEQLVEEEQVEDGPPDVEASKVDVATTADAELGGDGEDVDVSSSTNAVDEEVEGEGRSSVAAPLEDQDEDLLEHRDSTDIETTTDPEDELQFADRGTAHDTSAEPTVGLAASRWAPLPRAPSLQQSQSEATTDLSTSIVMPRVPGFGSFQILNAPVPLRLGAADQHSLTAPSNPSRTAATSTPHGGEDRRFNFPQYALSVRDDQLLFWRYHNQNENMLRTVMIRGVPEDAMLAEVVDQVRGGKIVSAKYLETATMRTTPPMPGNTVLIVFLVAKQAKAFVESCVQRPVTLFFGRDHKTTMVKADVQLAPTPSCFVNPWLQHKMHKEGLTRVLFIIFEDLETVPTPREAVQEIINTAREAHFHVVPRWPLHGKIEKDGLTMIIEFGDVEQAAMAWEAVRLSQWRDLSKGWLADPCGRPIERENAHEGRDEDENEAAADVVGVEGQEEEGMNNEESGSTGEAGEEGTQEGEKEDQDVVGEDENEVEENEEEAADDSEEEVEGYIGGVKQATIYWG